jgi:type IV secretion system protein VirB11
MLLTAFTAPIREALLADDVIEILANPDGSLWIERAGIGLTRSDLFLDVASRERVIRLVASSVGSSCDRASPILSAELPGAGERFEGILPPVSEGPCFAIRKPSSVVFTLDDYVASGALTPALCAALREAIAERLNIVIAGGTSSGKTTFTNALLAEPAFADERVVILEDTRELRCNAEDCVALRTWKEGKSLVELVRSTMRLRPDRILVGEVRGGEALDLLKAWNTGHPGGITTLHANSALGALTRLEQLVSEASSRPADGLIAEAVDVVVFMSREDGIRRVTDAIRVNGFNLDGYDISPLSAPKLSIVKQGDT